MSEKQKQETYAEIWRILENYESTYTALQPTISYSSETESYEMKEELFAKFPEAVKSRLKAYLTVVR